MRKKLVTKLVTIVTLVTMTQMTIISPVEMLAVESAEYKVNNPRVTEDNSTWDCIWFGNYYQSNSSKKEPIKWRVLSVDGNDAFVWSDKILDCKRYHSVHEDVTWEKCEVRGWLNNDFLNTAFSTSEISAIKDTKVINDGNVDWNMDASNDTYDKVYLLSITEAKNISYGFSPNYKENDTGRRGLPTQYSIEKGIYVSKHEEWKGWSSTWLRSPGRDSSEAAYISQSGYIIQGGGWVNNYETGIRPVMHIDLASTSVWSYAGTVSSDGTVKEVAAKKENATTTNATTTNATTTNDTEKTTTSTSGSKTDVNSTSKPFTKKVLTKKLSLKASKKKVRVGKKITIKVKYSPKNVTSKKVKWYVSNKKWASISKKGVLKAKKAGKGKTVIVKCKVLDGSRKTARIKIKIK